MHRLVISDFEVFPLWFVHNDRKYLNQWAVIDKSSFLCNCVKDLTVKKVSVENYMRPGAVDAPVTQHQLQCLLDRIVKLEEQNKRHAKQIEDLNTKLAIRNVRNIIFKPVPPPEPSSLDVEAMERRQTKRWIPVFLGLWMCPLHGT